jgi:hypothetical protein
VNRKFPDDISIFTGFGIIEIIGLLVSFLIIEFGAQLQATMINKPIYNNCIFINEPFCINQAFRRYIQNINIPLY